jgi:hypothetical protein
VQVIETRKRVLSVITSLGFIVNARTAVYLERLALF